ncbi:MAG TPA: universal stress protein [Spirochaetota bacterium]|jgi:universal stress protein A|nr:universal stress protein [Spirochaetota bacterium]OQA98234.1 MAG: putative universal stress protein [Spirochaetes bacterium ADurb.Bin218]HOK02187.1 universal stress protein [Spirochaetota bacterium]HOK92229.1 universal stress protein [Spirochaetota bacterium]HOQ11068.1 universal stress protein [Spirochaetota bacterium]
MKHKMKILVPVGFNEKPEELLDKAVSVAKKYNASIYVLHVIADMPKLTFYYDAYRLWENFRDSAIIETMDVLKKYIARMKESYNDIEPLVEVGEPATTILTKAEELNIDLIIMGHHIRTGLSHIIHQNTCERVVRHSSRPVLVLYLTEEP